jgi:hypothetical protein
MANFTLEQDDSPESNVEVKEETKVEETSEAKKEEVETTEGAATQETETAVEEKVEKEATVELDGQQIPLSQVKEALDVAKNQKDWLRNNTQKAQELADQKRQLQEFAYIAEQVKARPEILQQLFAPKPERDIDAEIRQMYAQRPIDFSSQEYVNWDYQVRTLEAEKVQQNILKQSQEHFSKTEAMRHNDTVYADGLSKYKEKTNADEFQQMSQWILQNVRPDQGGRYPKTAYDTAYRELFFEKAISEAKLEATRSVGKSIANAKPASGAPGATKRTETKTPEELDEMLFLEEMAARNKK